MVDQVSLTAIGGLSESRNKQLMDFLACGPGRPVVWDPIDVWAPVKFGLLRSLSHVSWFCAGNRHQGRIAREGSNDGDIQTRD